MSIAAATRMIFANAMHDSARRSFVAMLLGFLALNVAFKLTFENRDIAHLTVYEGLIIQRLEQQPWTVLLPIEIDPDGQHIRWTTTGWVPSVVCAKVFGDWNTVVILFSSALVAVTFVCSWITMRSKVFTSLITLFMVLGTQFNYASVNATCVLIYLFVIYLAINLTAVIRLHQLESPPRSAWWTFSISLISLALCWEMWLDYGVFLIVAIGFTSFWLRRHFPDRKCPSKKLLGVVAATIAVYLAARIPFASEFTAMGREAEVVTSYAYPMMAIEDVFSNIMTYTYISLTNYLPPFVLVSNSLLCHGEAKLIAEQHGYHAQYTHLTAQHHLFFWHFYAGAVFVTFLSFVARTLRKALTQNSVQPLVLSLFCFMVLFGCATHCLIKFRPYLSVPILSYKCTVAVVGASLLFAYLATLLIETRRRPGNARWLFCSVCALLVLAAFTRPRMQSEMLQRVGCSGPPDPIDNIKTLFE